MLDVESARLKILDAFVPLETIEIEVAHAAGMVSSTDLYAPHALPRFDNSAMDGYAVRRSDITDVPITLPLAGEVRAGDAADEPLPDGSAVRIMTGAPIPAGADAVVPIEDVVPLEDTDGPETEVTVIVAPRPAAHIRPAGDDVAEGDLLVASGTELAAGELALLASMGLSPVRVHRRPHVVVLSTGDELVAPEADPGPGQIRDSNSVALRALVTEAGGSVEVVGPIADDREGVHDAVLEATKTADLIVSSGGVSVGKYDHVKEVIEDVGSLEFWRVAMQPGKPVVSGRAVDVPFLGLPGNPVSIHIGFEQFVRPAIRKMRGCNELLRPTVTARLASRIEKNPGRLHFVRVKLRLSEEGFVAEPTGAQGSHIQSSLVGCHGVARFAVEASVLEEGDPVTVEVWRLP